MLRALWQHRALIASLVRREFHARSARAVWGNAWLVIQPATMIFIYTVIFGAVMRARLPGVDDTLAYGIYLCSGVITWNYFSDIVMRSQTLFLDHADLLKSLSFPRSALPVALFGSATLNFTIVIGLFLIVLATLGRWPGMALLGAIPLLAVQILLGLGLGILTGTLNVFFRDIGQAVGVVMQFWFWLTPIVYSIEIVPERLKPFFAWNPMYGVMSGYQRIVVSGSLPDWNVLLPSAVVALALALAGWGVFRTLSADVVDEL